MNPIYRKLIFFVVPVFLPLSLGYGESEEEIVKVPKSPPQITITLRSDFTITQSLDPDPQYEKTEELKQGKGKKKKERFSRRIPSKPTYKADANYQSLNRFENSVTEIFKIDLEKKNELKRMMPIIDILNRIVFKNEKAEDSFADILIEGDNIDS